MKKATLTIPILALTLLGAHALRQGDFGLALTFGLLACGMFSCRAWVRLVGVTALLWGAWIWADATVEFLRFRQAFGLPWVRLAWIMGGVIVLDGLGLVTLLSGSARDWFDRQAEQAWPRAAVAVLVTAGLAVARAKASFPILLADRYFPGWGWLEIAGLAFYAQWMLGLMASPKGHRTYRPRIWALFSAVFFLQLVLGLLGMDRMLMTGTLHLPVPALILAGPVFRGGGFFMVILFSFTLLLVGPAWCSHLCYIGAWDDVMSRLGARSVPDAWLRRIGILGRGATLLICVAAALVLRAMGMPGARAVLFAAAFGLIGVGIMVFISRKRGMMVHCTAYCPMGLVANVLGRISPWRMTIGGDCTRCGACFSHCRYNALDEVQLEQGKPALTCTLCGDCVSACAHRQIGYRFPGISPYSARSVFLVLAVGLHALFLGVARM